MKTRIYHRSQILISSFIIIISTGISFAQDNLPEHASLKTIKHSAGNPAIRLEKDLDPEDWMIEAGKAIQPDYKSLHFLLIEEKESPIKLEGWMLDGCDWCNKKRTVRAG